MNTIFSRDRGRRYQNWRSGFSLFFLVLALSLAVLHPTLLRKAAAAGVSVRAAVEKQEVFVGEGLFYQIQVEGSDTPEEPDLSGFTDFNITPRGGQKNSSESISIINGRMERVSRLGYVFNYQLQPKREGNLLIPSVSVRVGQEVFQTNPVAILARKPMETEDFKLRLRLEKDTVYEGEPIELTVVWYLGKDVRNFELSLPVVSDDRFSMIPTKVDVPAGHEANYLKIALDGKEVIARKGRGALDGKEYTTVSFAMTLIGKQPGQFQLPRATVSCEAMSAYKSNRRRDPMDPFGQDDIFQDFFRRGGRDQYQSVVIPSNEVGITIKALPDAGRPASFSGLIGDYSVATQATPLEANVGDPITLTVMVTGPKYLDNVTLPALKNMPGFGDAFKIPDEIAPGSIDVGAKVFTQTIRANNPEVKEIPPVLLSFFNPVTGVYETAQSAAIPVTIKATRVVTAADAEGFSAPGALQRSLTNVASGIAANYEDASVLEPQAPLHALWELSTGWIAFFSCPPLFFMLLAGTVFLRRRREDTSPALRAKRAFAVLGESLSSLDSGIRKGHPTPEANARLLEALRHYLGDKLRMNPASLTPLDAEAALRNNGVQEELIRDLVIIFRRFEEYRYGGGRGGGADVRELLDKVRQVAHDLDKTL